MNMPRGGLLDVVNYAKFPVRIDFYGDIESIKSFNPISQISLKILKAYFYVVLLSLS